MQSLFLALLAIGLLLILVFIVYLVDRVNNLERKAGEVADVLTKSRSPGASGPFGGLSGKKLWEAMSGMPVPGADPGQFDEIRERYATVLLKHVDAVFEEGVQAGKFGLSAEVSNTRQISTLRGQVESWLPQTQVNTIYQCGVDTSIRPADQLPSVCQTYQEALQALCDRVQLPVPDGYPATLQTALLALNASPPGGPSGDVSASGKYG